MEIEVKIAVEALEPFEKKAEALGYEVVHPFHFEANTLFDFPGRPLSVQGCLLRVRETPEGSLLTFKGRLVHHDRFKVRPEKETRCQDGAALREILSGIGLRPFFRYEKYRKEMRAPGGGLLCLDLLPFGSFLELEGPEEAIEAMAAELGLLAAAFIRRSYADLYGEYCRERGLPFGDIVFPEGHGHP